MNIGSWDTAIVKAVLIGYIPILWPLLFGLEVDFFFSLPAAIFVILGLMMSFPIYLWLAAIFWLLVGLPVHRIAVRYFNGNWLIYCCVPLLIVIVSFFLWNPLNGIVIASITLQLLIFRYGVFRDSKP